jgi:hypothetical protein
VHSFSIIVLDVVPSAVWMFLIICCAGLYFAICCGTVRKEAEDYYISYPFYCYQFQLKIPLVASLSSYLSP